MDESKGHGSDLVSSDVQYGPHGWCPSRWGPIKDEEKAQRPNRLQPLDWMSRGGYREEHLEAQEGKATLDIPQAALRLQVCPRFKRKPREILKGPGGSSTLSDLLHLSSDLR